MRNLQSFRFFWHPWHPWGRLSSGDIWVLRFVLNILLQRCHLAEIFIFIKMISHVHFIILVHQTVILSLLILTKLTIDKIHHLIRLRFEQSELKKSQCAPRYYLKDLNVNVNPGPKTSCFVSIFDTPVTIISHKKFANCWQRKLKAIL